MKTMNRLKIQLCLLLGLLLSIGSAFSNSGLTPEEALQKLKAGNQRYATGNSKFPNLTQNRRNLTNTNGQHPFATIIGCSDSRVPIEHIFDAGIGDIFSIRVAGNVSDVDEVGSIEYGVEHLNTPILVVLGHTSCGAVTAVTRGDEVHGSIPALVDNIIPAVEKAKHEHGHDFNSELLAAAIDYNVWQSIEDLLSKSPGTVKLVESGKLLIVGAIYDLATGKVRWMGEHPKQASLLSQAASNASAGHGESDWSSASSHETVNQHTSKTGKHTSSSKLHAAKEKKSHLTTITIIILVTFLAFVFFFLLNTKTALKLSLKQRILALSLTLLALMLGIGLVSYISMNKIGKELHSIANEDIPLTEKITHIETSALKQSITLEKLLRSVYENGIYTNTAKQKIVDFEREIENLSEEVDMYFNEAENACIEVLNTTSDQRVLNEFSYILEVLEELDANHEIFEQHANELFNHINQGDLHFVKQREEIIESELHQLDLAIEEILTEIEAFTAQSALSAEKHEKEAILLIIALALISLVIGLSISLLMASQLKTIISNIMSSAENISSASHQLSSTSQEMSQGASEQASSVEEVSSTMEQIASNIEQNTENAQQTEKISLSANEGMNKVAKKSVDAVEANKNIAEKITIINDIAFQTNILALNAAVEAARAGEHGKGFAVVAAEVRKLAERSKIAAEEIVGLAKQSLNLAEDASSVMTDTIPQIENTTKLVQEIAAASHEQNNGTAQINDAVQQLNSVSQQNAAASEELATSAEELSSQAEELKNVVSYFTTGRVGNSSQQTNNQFVKEFKVKNTNSTEKGTKITLTSDDNDNHFESF